MRRVLHHPPMAAWVVLAGLLAGGPLAGCGALRPLGTSSDTGILEGDADADADADTDTEVVATGDVPITGIDPPWGSNLGGSLVTVTGGPFSADAQVFFNGVQSPFLAAVNVDLIVATVPTSGAIGPVDVRVDSGGLSGTAPGAFEYWEDATGNYGVYGEFGWNVPRGDYWGAPPPVANFYGVAWFAEPGPDPYWKVSYSDKMDSCSNSYARTAAPLLTGAATMDLVSGTHVVSLLPDPSDAGVYGAGSSTVPNADVLIGGDYALAPLSGADWPQFTAPNFTLVPSNDPDVTTPNIDSASAITQLEASFDFVWSSPFDADYVLLDLYRVRYGAPSIERVSCVAKDDGSFKVPSGLFSSWETGVDQIIIYVGRAVEAEGTLPYNNAKSGLVGVHWEYGAVYAK